MSVDTKPAPDAKTLEKVRQLMALAIDEEASEEEARSASHRAIKLMHEHELAVIPKSALDDFRRSVEGVKALQAKAKESKTENMLMGLAIGAFLGKKLF